MHCLWIFLKLKRKLKLGVGEGWLIAEAVITACPSAFIAWYISSGPPEAQSGISSVLTDSMGHLWQKSKCSAFECLSLNLTKRHSNGHDFTGSSQNLLTWREKGSKAEQSPPHRAWLQGPMSSCGTAQSYCKHQTQQAQLKISNFPHCIVKIGPSLKKSFKDGKWCRTTHKTKESRWVGVVLQKKNEPKQLFRLAHRSPVPSSL